MFNIYEAWDEEKDYCIYSGSSKNDMIYLMHEYIEGQNHINEDLISNNSINNLDNKELRKVGIKVFVHH